MPAVITPPSPAPIDPPAAAAAAVPRGCTHFQLRQLARQVGQVYDAELAVAGLKTTQYSLLSCVQRLGPVRPADLAVAMKMAPSTLTRNLQPLVAAGWVSLQAGADGRSRLVGITPAGQALHGQARGHWRAAQDRLNCCLGEPRVAALHALIQESLSLLAPPGPETDDAP